MAEVIFDRFTELRKSEMEGARLGNKAKKTAKRLGIFTHHMTSCEISQEPG